ncbi:sulfotransferase domain-containing protein [Salinibacter ruber]|uniref:sulfotransferase domain-containing protein n=1 Tax=Salinibacter ruber TaxID=146919 RepID=UPI00161BDF8B|nr:sulfotransferase domain-containing protein [Salinibacter ruber]
MKNLLKRVKQSRVKNVANVLLKSFSKFKSKKYKSSKTIILSGTGRSGTTWVSEIICSKSGIEMLYEPFSGDRELKKYDINSVDLYLSEKNVEQKQYDYLENIILKRNVTLDKVKDEERIWNVINARRLLIKCIHGNRLLPFVEKSFDIKSILLIRHPCAVISSQIRYDKGWGSDLVDYVESGRAAKKIEKGIKNEEYESMPVQRLERLDKKMGGIVQRIETIEQFLAFEWVCDLIVPLDNVYNNRKITFYEDLVKKGKKEVDKIFSHLGEEVTKSAYKTINKPSSTTQKESNVAKGKSPLLAWKENLNKSQIERILKFVHDAGIKMYTKKVKPIKEKKSKIKG